MKDKKAFGSFIKEKRIEKNYSQKDLAELLYVTESAVSKWERGVTYPDITLITDLCRVLDVTEHELIESSHDSKYREMQNDAAKYNRLKTVFFWILNISYITALLTCFIVNLAVNHKLSWFFIVLTSILCAYTFCPTITWLFKKFKKVVFIASTFTSIFLMLLTISIYSHNYWFMIPTVGVLIGYFIIFYPILFVNQKKYITDKEYTKLSKFFPLTYIGGMLILVCLLLVFIYIYNPFNILLGLIITVGCFTIPLIYGVILVLECGNKLIKPITIALVGIVIFISLFSLGSSLLLKFSEETTTHNIEGYYNSIKIDVNTYDVNIYLSESNENKVIYKQNKKMYIETKIIDGVLTINQIEERRFYERAFDNFSYKLDLYLSIDLINRLTIDGSTSDITIYKGITFDEVDITLSTGDIVFNSNVTNNLNTYVSTGDVTIKNSNIGGNLKIRTSTGDVILSNVNCDSLNMNLSTGDVELANVIVTNDAYIDGSTTDVKLDGFDATNIYITLGTGSVKGTILSSKIFAVRSSTGSINVPDSISGGICKIDVSTGSINITYK